MRWPPLLVVGVVVFAAACSGSTSGGDPTSPTGDPSAASPSSPVATASVPGSSVAFDNLADASLTALSEEPVVGPEGTESFVNPGGVTYHDGQFHMLRNSFTGYPGPTTTTYLASEDGLVWEEQADEPVLETADVPFANEEDTVFVMSLLVDGDTWVAYLYNLDNDLNPGYIGRATADDPAGPWTVDPEPVLDLGEDGAFDERRVAEPSVVRTADGWSMYYVGFDADRVTRIGLATSDDGVEWTRHDGPVLEGSAEWDGGEIGGPQVAAVDGGFVMVYDNAVPGEYGLGLAVSTDGVEWEPVATNPQLTPEDTPASQFFQTELVEGPDGLLLLVEIGTGTTRTDLYPYAVEGS